MTYNDARQPVLAILAREVALQKWPRIMEIGPTQGGKTLIGFVGPVLYHAGEIGETICIGIPMMDMARDKWENDIKPAIEAGEFAWLLPKKGAGSRGGRFNSIRLANGAVIKFLAAAGSVKSVAGFTSRVLIATEIDGYDHVSKNSEEGDKLSLMEGRLLSYGADARTYLECTISVEEGRSWQEYISGTASNVYCPCPHCGVYVSLERHCLVGWQDAENEVQAARLAHWECPECHETITEKHREKMLRKGVLVHRAMDSVTEEIWLKSQGDGAQPRPGQHVDKSGVVHGPVPETFTLGFRFHAGWNLFYDAAYIGALEWRAQRAPDKAAAETKLCQQFWVIPPPKAVLEEYPLTVAELGRHATGVPRGVVPAWADLLSVGADVGKRRLHYVITAWASDASKGLVVDYGTIETDADTEGEERGVALACEMLAKIWQTGNAIEGTSAIMRAHRPMIDQGYLSAVLARVAKTHNFWRSKGFSSLQRIDKYYRTPTTTGSQVLKIGEGYHWTNGRYGIVCHFNADHFKSWVHARLQTPDDQPGWLRCWGQPSEHREFFEHLTSEQQVDDGGVLVWRKVQGANHYLDALVESVLAARERGLAVVPPSCLPTPLQEQTPRRTACEAKPEIPLGQIRRGARRIRSHY